MRKMKMAALILILVLSLTITSNASSDIKVVVNDEGITFPDAKPYINEDDRTLVPVRFISEALSCEVDWKGETRQVGIVGRGKEIKLNIGENEAFVDDNKIEFDTKSIIKEDRTFVPLRFVSEALGAKVEWNGETRTIYITTETPKKTTVLTKKDIERLRGYKLFKETKYFDFDKNEWIEGVSPSYISFDDESKFTRKRREGTIRLFDVKTVVNKHKKRVYPSNVDLKFITKPNLLYMDALGTYVLRGVLQIETPNKDNEWGIKPNHLHEVDAEYLYLITTDGNYIMEVNYLSGFRKVKSTEED